MIYLILALLATGIGATSGLGGGLIIKPCLTMFSTNSPTMINFYSACAVLSMTIFSYLIIIKNREFDFKPIYTALIIGSILGGNWGSNTFSLLVTNSSNPNTVIMIQAIGLIICLVAILIFNKIESNIELKHNFISFLLAGLIMGYISSFLGIGGGPVNILIFTKILNIKLKTAVQLSLLTILFTQVSTLISLTSTPIDYNIMFIIYLVIGSIGGAIIGRMLYLKLSTKQIKLLFNGVLYFVIFLNILLIFK